MYPLTGGHQRQAFCNHPLLVRCTRNVADLQYNARHVEYHRPRSSRAGTPLDGEDLVLLGLSPLDADTFTIGTGTSNAPHLQISLTNSDGVTHAEHIASAMHLRLQFTDNKYWGGLCSKEPATDGCWVVVDTSRNGTMVNNVDFLASPRAQASHRDLAERRDTLSDRVVLHPQQWNILDLGGCKIHVFVGSRKPCERSHTLDLGQLSNSGMLGLSDAGSAIPSRTASYSSEVCSTSYSYSSSASAAGVKPSRYYSLSIAQSKQRSKRVYMRKTNGGIVFGRTAPKGGERATRHRFHALARLQRRHYSPYLLQYEHMEAHGRHLTIFTPYVPAESLRDLLDQDNCPSAKDLTYVFGQTNAALSDLARVGMQHNNVQARTILVQNGMPITTKLTGFSFLTASQPVSTSPTVTSVQPGDVKQVICARTDVMDLARVIENCYRTVSQKFSTSPTTELIRGCLSDSHASAPPLSTDSVRGVIEKMNGGLYRNTITSSDLNFAIPLHFYQQGDTRLLQTADFCTLVHALGLHSNRVVQMDTYHDVVGNVYCKTDDLRQQLVDLGHSSSLDLLGGDNLRPGSSLVREKLTAKVRLELCSGMLDISPLLRIVDVTVGRRVAEILRPQTVQYMAGTGGHDSNLPGVFVDRQTWDRVFTIVSDQFPSGFERGLSAPPDVLSDGLGVKGYFGRLTSICLCPTGYLTPPYIGWAWDGTEALPEVTNAAPIPILTCLDDAQRWLKEADCDKISGSPPSTEHWWEVPRFQIEALSYSALSTLSDDTIDYVASTFRPTQKVDVHAETKCEPCTFPSKYDMVTERAQQLQGLRPKFPPCRISTTHVDETAARVRSDSTAYRRPHVHGRRSDSHDSAEADGDGSMLVQGQ